MRKGRHPTQAEQHAQYQSIFIIPPRNMGAFMGQNIENLRLAHHAAIALGEENAGMLRLAERRIGEGGLHLF